jgi:iron complex transport system ATP-binding protein
MAQGARLLLLDEPVNNLDPKYALSAMDILKNLTKQGVTAILSLHDLHLAALYADRVAVVFQGGIAAFGKPEETLTEATVERVFEVSAKMLQSTFTFRGFSDKLKVCQSQRQLQACGSG